MGGIDLLLALNKSAQFGRGQPVEDPVPKKSKPVGFVLVCDDALSHDVL